MASEHGLGDGAAGGGDLAEGGLNGGDGEVRAAGVESEDGFGDGAKVTELTIGGGEFVSAFAGEFLDDLPEEAAADLKCGLLPYGKRAAGEEYGAQSGLVGREGGEIAGDDGYFFQFAGGGGDAFASFGKFSHPDEPLIPMPGFGTYAILNWVPGPITIIQ